MQLAGLHHVTCVCSDAQRTLDFYRDELGFSLVKKTVNFDDPHSYHLYFGDEVGTPGTLITFFEWPRAEPGRLGRGTLESIGLETPRVDRGERAGGSRRAAAAALSGRAPRLRDVVVIGNPDLYAGPLRRGRAARVRRADRGARADRRGHDPPHRVARRPTTRSRRPGSSASPSSACGRRPCRTASTSARSTSGCRTAS